MTGTIDSNTEQTFQISGLDCASCALTVEKGVGQLDGIAASSLNFTTETLRVTGDVDAEQIISRVKEMGYGVASPNTGQEDQPATQPVFQPTRFLTFMRQHRYTRLALLAAVLILPGLVWGELLGRENWLVDGLAIVATAIAGYPIARSAWTSLKINREININVLMTIAAFGAIIIGAYVEAGMVMVLFALGEALEGFTGAKARESIRSLLTVAPQEAIVLRPCIDCAGHLGQDGYTGGPCPWCGLEEHLVPVSDLQVGERIVVKPGDRIPMDGRVLSGESAINQAPITGESRLIEKEAGDTVFASSINGAGALEIEVTHLAADNTISRLIQMVEEAQEKRAPAQRFVDQFARYYTPAVVVLAVLVATIPPLFFGQPFWNIAGQQGWLYRALALLVVACPCALVISTPVTLVSAISNGARHGVLFKGGAYLEALSRVRAIAFDKTGTLTLGQPAVVAVQSVHCTDPESGLCADCDDLLALTHAVERRSEHPLAAAITAAATAQGVAQKYETAQIVTALTGRGITGKVDGRSVLVASHRHFDREAIPHLPHCGAVTEATVAGYTAMLVSQDADYQGYIIVADTVRDSSKTAVSQLKALGLDALVMLTGDNVATAQKVADDVGLSQVMADCLPEDKVMAVNQLRQQYEHVAMVGDGINDAPALATASVGIAIGNTAQAMETADISLMGGDLRQLPFAIRLARAAMQTVKANVALSIGIKLIFLLLVLVGLGSMWLAVLADMGTSLLVTLNGMRLLQSPKTEM